MLYNICIHYLSRNVILETGTSFAVSSLLLVKLSLSLGSEKWAIFEKKYTVCVCLCVCV